MAIDRAQNFKQPISKYLFNTYLILWIASTVQEIRETSVNKTET